MMFYPIRSNSLETIFLQLLLLCLLVVSSVDSYDSNFACCGGCSSMKRSDGNEKIPTGFKVFIWDVGLKIDPAEACTKTFPYDPALNEQEGTRRVRSGRLVGTSYPIDHDYDHMCCDQGGVCLALDEDASGKCKCVKRWGFTGDHCEHSIYDAARFNNTRLFPNVTNLTTISHYLPDLRSYLFGGQVFDLDQAIRQSRSDNQTTNTVSFIQDLFTKASYRQYAYGNFYYFVFGMVFFLWIFVMHVLWTVCFFKCGCRKRDPTKTPKIYSRLSKILTGFFMVLFLLLTLSTCGLTFFTVQDILKLSDSTLQEITHTIPNGLESFRSNFLGPLDQVVQPDVKNFDIPSLQEEILTKMISHQFFLDVDTHVQLPVFNTLNQLQSLCGLYPTSLIDDCQKQNITPSIVSRMTIGAKTGCYRCKFCSLMNETIERELNFWIRNPRKAQRELNTSRAQLLEFAKDTTLEQRIEKFRTRLHTSMDDFLSVHAHVSEKFQSLEKDIRLFTFYGMCTLVVLCGLLALLSCVSFIHGMQTQKRYVARTNCFFGQLTVLVALIMTGVLYTIIFLAKDSIQVLELYEQSTNVLFLQDETAFHAEYLLFDQNLVQVLNMKGTLEFSDTLRVPPHPTPQDDHPKRYDLDFLYTFQEIQSIRQVCAQPQDQAIIQLFGWEESFLQQQWSILKGLVFGNESQVSPYTGTVHMTLMSSTLDQLIDPDNDTLLATDKDEITIKQIFNITWIGVNDRGVHQNQLIKDQWFFTAEIYYQKLRLKNYTQTIIDIIDTTSPTLDQIKQKTKEMEMDTFSFKQRIEELTDTLRASKIQDCGYNRNCGWLRQSFNDLFKYFQSIILKAQFASTCCAACFVCALIGVFCNMLFAKRLRINVVKVYSAN